MKWLAELIMLVGVASTVTGVALISLPIVRLLALAHNANGQKEA
jgi:hypothetical protein